jgi:hypothetical protein
LLSEAGFAERNPLSYSMLTNGTEGALPTIATMMQTPCAKRSMELTVGIINRSIFLQRLTKDRGWEQAVNLPGATADPSARILEAWSGNDPITEDDQHVEILVGRLKEARTE